MNRKACDHSPVICEHREYFGAFSESESHITIKLPRDVVVSLTDFTAMQKKGKRHGNPHICKQLIFPNINYAYWGKNALPRSCDIAYERARFHLNQFTLDKFHIGIYKKNRGMIVNTSHSR